MFGFHKKTYISNNGYEYTHNPKSPDARRDGYAPKHRDVARKKLKRDIAKDEVVHHKDGNKLNNRKSNLEVMKRKDHSRLHQKETGAKFWFFSKSK